jgi:hypothetical protein
MHALIHLILFTIAVCHCDAEEWIAVKDIKAEELLIDYAQLNEPEHLKKSFYKNSEETLSAMNAQQRSELLSNLSHRYINFINNIGSGKDSRGVEAPSLFSKNCRKNFNGRWVANDRDSFVTDLVSVYRNYGSWKLIPIDIITAYENEKIILRINIESKSFGNNTAIVILRYNSDYLIEEILEVFSPVQNGYDFNDHKAESSNSDP